MAYLLHFLTFSLHTIFKELLKRQFDSTIFVHVKDGLFSQYPTPFSLQNSRIRPNGLTAAADSCRNLRFPSRISG